MNPIHTLENLTQIISYDKASILLVCGNLKPSAMVFMQGEPFPAGSDIVHVEPANLSGMDAALVGLSLAYISTTEVMDAIPDSSGERSQEVVRFFVAHDTATAERLKTVFDDIQNNHHEAGMLLGYPKTAVDAFLTDEMLSIEEHPTSTEEVSELNMKLLGHRLSKQHWREEVKYLEEAGNYLQATSPKLYAEVIADTE